MGFQIAQMVSGVCHFCAKITVSEGSLEGPFLRLAHPKLTRISALSGCHGSMGPNRHVKYLPFWMSGMTRASGLYIFGQMDHFYWN